MGEKSSIEWTDATWNVWDGCDQVSPGCAHCYIVRQPPFRTKRRTFVNGSTTREIHENRLEWPRKWKDPRLIFVNSLSDFFLPDIPNSLRDRMLAVMHLHRRHTYQILTKRHEAAEAYLNDPDLPTRVGLEFGRLVHGQAYAFDMEPDWPFRNVWWGVTAENQTMADLRIPSLLRWRVAVRFVSFEPLLSYIDARAWMPWIDWGIAGGESGFNARVMLPAWARGLRDQHVEAGKAFHFKQWGEWGPVTYYELGTAGVPSSYLGPDNRVYRLAEDHVRRTADGVLGKIGKKAAGRLLDGREWNERPAARAA